MIPPPSPLSTFTVWSIPTLSLPNDAPELLSAAESQRALRFHHHADRQSYTAAHTVKRLVLGHVLKQPPRNLQFAATPEGRPFLTHPDPAGWDFNLSHTRGLALFALRHGHPVGVDVENTENRGDDRLTLDLLDALLSPEEREHIQALPTDRRSQLLHQAWVAREAFAKACGAGIAQLDPKSIVPPPPFPGLDGAGPPVALQVPSPWAASGPWFLHPLQTPPSFAAAVVTRGCEVPDLRAWNWQQPWHSDTHAQASSGPP